MTQSIRRQSLPDPWVNQLFSTRSALNGGVIRRNAVWVEREVGLDRFAWEVRRRGFHLVKAGTQYVVICSPDPVTVLF